MVGNSTSGSAETGRNRNTKPPARAKAAVNSDVATGLLINGSERFIAQLIGMNRLAELRARDSRFAAALETGGQTIKEQVNNRCRVECQNLTDNQSADDR